MTHTGKTSGIALRLLCAMLLVVLGFAHRPVSASAMPMDMSAYALPDGTMPTICIPDESGGKTGKDIQPEKAMEHIFGFTIFNDFSARDAQYVEMAGQLGPEACRVLIENAKADLLGQVSPDTKAGKAVLERYPKAQVRKFDGKPEGPPTELDAMIAYLQMLGTLVDFTTFDAAGPNLR